MKRKLLLALVVAAALCALAFFFVVPGLVDGGLNATLRPPPYEVSGRARELHGRLFVADLHADTLLWGRGLLVRSSRGHVDLPRLIEGGVGLQFFTVVTKAPRGLNYETNDSGTDNITTLVVAQRWPLRTWKSLKERALHQSRLLHEAAERSGGRLTVVRTADDLARFLERRKGEPSAVATLLGIEGAHALDADLSNLGALYDAGFRMVAPVHFFDNEWGGSAHGIEKGGLTPAGRELIKRLEERRMLVDLAHASERTFDDALSVATRPVVVSHTGVRGACDNNRNLTDEQVRRVAATGGLIGVGFWETATCGTDARSIARSLRHVASLVGARHAALGSDFDGAVTTPFDASGVAQVTEALLAEGFGEEEVRMIMGGNVIRLLGETLPREE
ncbi:MAG TPA: dipeptidase [Pyrinomonadaceae bacterium]|nr:dipeptidase [Pyrinomonadaceae bacterium]